MAIKHPTYSIDDQVKALKTADLAKRNDLLKIRINSLEDEIFYLRQELIKFKQIIALHEYCDELDCIESNG